MLIHDELLTRYDMLPFDEYKEGFSDDKTAEESCYRTFLMQTDHIPLKIFENFIEGMATASIVGTIGVIVNFFKDVKDTYNDVLTYRKIARDEINKLNAEINTLQGGE